MQFNQVEKAEFAERVRAFTNLVNDLIIPHLFESRYYQIGEVGFGIKIAGEYFYFDYPYGPGIEKINKDLADDNSPIGGIDQRIFEAFNKSTEKGYIYYEYLIINEKFSARCKTNVQGLAAKDVLSFLPVIHYSIYEGKNTEHLSTVQPAGDMLLGKHPLRLLYLNKSLHDITDARTTDKPNILTAAFTTQQEVKDPRLAANELYKSVFPFLESYFASPLVVKLMEEKRKSHVMAYLHSYGNIAPLLLNLAIKARDAVKEDPAMQAKVGNKLNRLYAGLNAEYLTLSSMFQTDASYQSAEYSSKHPFLEKSFLEILHYYYQLSNYLDAKAEIKIIDPCYDKKNYCPKDIDLPDIHLVLWNLWENACREVENSGETVYVTLNRNPNNRNIEVCFSNKGELLPIYVAYIRGEASYPSKIEAQQTYKGLEIVGDKLNERKWTWSVTIENGMTFITVNFQL
jgi:hypothetical protein